MRGSIAVIGAGVSGLTAAQRLSARLADADGSSIGVHVLEWGRGPGGRTARKRVSAYDGATELSFDHALPFFDCITREFEEHVLSQWIPAGAASQWHGQFAECQLNDNGHTVIDMSSRLASQRFVGTPAANDVCKHMAKQIEQKSAFGSGSLSYGMHVLSARFEEASSQWKLTIQDRWSQESSEHKYDGLVLSDKLLLQPNKYQVLSAMDASRFSLPRSLGSNGTIVLMIAFEHHLLHRPDQWDVIEFSSRDSVGHIVSRLVHDSAKPMRGGASACDCWVMYSTAAYAETHLDGEDLADEALVKTELLHAFEQTILMMYNQYVDAQKSIFAGLFAWDNAQPIHEGRLVESYLQDERKAGVCGDIFLKDETIHGMEAATLSGKRLADSLEKEFR